MDRGYFSVTLRFIVEQCLNESVPLSPNGVGILGHDYLDGRLVLLAEQQLELVLVVVERLELAPIGGQLLVLVVQLEPQANASLVAGNLSN